MLIRRSRFKKIENQYEYLTLILKPQPKPRLQAEKSHYGTTSPPAQPSGGSGGGGCFLYSLEDLLNKNVSYRTLTVFM
jgi:hypothetical protein